MKNNMTNKYELALTSIGFGVKDIQQLSPDQLAITGDFAVDSKATSQHLLHALGLLAKLPPKAKRSSAEKEAASHILELSREQREKFLTKHVQDLYEKLTNHYTQFVRMDQLVLAASKAVPGLTPSLETLQIEGELLQSEKDGHEIDQGIFLSHVLANVQCGMHLCHTMLLPHPETASYYDQLLKDGRLELNTSIVEKNDQSINVYFKNGRFLHAEDDNTLRDMEIAVDLAIQDPTTQIAVLRGDFIQEGKYKGLRTFSTGINLTRLYRGKIPFLWYMDRDMGFINKIYRGIAYPEITPNEILGKTNEKLWIAAIDRFAIGGGCQYLLVMDINIAGESAYLTLPARKEGIIPGVANMRMPRFVGDRVTRQAIMMERRIECASPEGRLICDYVVPDQEIDQTIQSTIDLITSSGVVSASSNRKSFRVAQEPLDMFRQYMAVYAKEQAYCHFSPALISNLERNWDAQNRKLESRAAA
jgi:thioesterase DpgC